MAAFEKREKRMPNQIFREKTWIILLGEMYRNPRGDEAL